MPHPIIVVTLDGLTPAALSCYGSSWNQTPVIDQIASNGIVWDRCLASSDDPTANFRELADKLISSIRRPGGDKTQGTIDLVTDSPVVADAARDRNFQQIDFVASETVIDSGESSVDIAETQLGRLVAAALDHHTHHPGWGLMWLHSRYLTQRWDAPRTGWSIDVEQSEAEDLSHAAAESANAPD